MIRNELMRIVDANINRATEALRVIEDWARFGKNCSTLAEKIKKIRHEINSLFSSSAFYVLNRESQTDVGRSIDSFSGRKTIRDIISANCKRAEEALRSLSEYSVLLNLEIISVKKLEEFRYVVYSIEKELLIQEKLLRLLNSKLYLVTNRDSFESDTDFLKVIEKAVQGGVNIIQLREKTEGERKILYLAKEIKKIISGSEVLFIVNDRTDLALACEADGVHLGQNDLPVNEARKITPQGFIIGLSTHSVEQGQKALKTGADYIGVGPVFQTSTKPEYKTCGFEYVGWASENIKDISWFAIGGINETNIDKVINAGAKKIAVVRAIMNSKDPLKTIKLMKEIISSEKTICV